MNGFGFIEYKDPMDARDVVPGEFDRNIDQKICDNFLTGASAPLQPSVRQHSRPRCPLFSLANLATKTDLISWESDLPSSLPVDPGTGRAVLATMSVLRHGLVEPLTGCR